jgi:hypothetical protein
MSVPQFLRFVAVNNTGQTIAYDTNGRLNLKVTGVHVDPATGKETYTQLSDDDLGFGAGDSTTDGGEDLSGEIDNTATKYTGFQVQLEVTHDEGAAADGNYDLYLDGGDASGELASDASGYDDAETNGLDQVGSLVWPSTGDDDELMRSPVFEVW